MLVCLDLEAAAAELAAGLLPCPSCRAGRLASWGHGREREVRLRDGRTARLEPPRGRCGSCRRTHLLLSAWCAPRRRHGLEVIGTAAGLAVKGNGHRKIAAALGVPDGTVRGWLRRLRANAGQLEDRVRGEMRALQMHAPVRVAGTPLGDALNVPAAAADCAMDRLRLGPEMTWPLIGRLGLARALMPARAG